MKTKEELKEKITKKLTDMGFDSFTCILNTNDREEYMEIIYPELGLCFFKKYHIFPTSFAEEWECVKNGAWHRFKEFIADENDIKKFNKTLKLRTVHNDIFKNHTTKVFPERKKKD